MSQIDKAFLSAYSKKPTTVPSSQETRPLVDPTGERLLKIHRSTIQASPSQPHVATLSRQTPQTETLPDTSSYFPDPSAKYSSQPLPPSLTSPPEKKGMPEATAPRKTLTSYLQQARQPNPAPTLPTSWSTAKPTAPTIPPLPPTPKQESLPERHVAPAATPQHRVDPSHPSYSSNPPIARPQSTIPWSYGTVERGMKATADSQSVSARIRNESMPSRPHSITDTYPIDDRFAPVAPLPESVAPASRWEAENTKSTATTRVASADSKPETQRRNSPVSRNGDADDLAKISTPIQPAWEVDEFLWPNATANLLALQEDAFYEIGLHLQHAQSKGLRVLSVTSGERGVGRSTVALCLAKTLSKLGMDIGLFDGDYESPGLVNQLNLEAECGWQQCFLENIPLEEVAIRSISESITFFPLTDSIAISHVATHAPRINKLIKRIANAHDMVIIDANRVTQKQYQLLGTGDEAVLDAAMLIIDAQLSLRQRVDNAVELISQQGIQSIGLVENFHS